MTITLELLACSNQVARSEYPVDEAWEKWATAADQILCNADLDLYQQGFDPGAHPIGVALLEKRPTDGWDKAVVLVELRIICPCQARVEHEKRVRSEILVPQPQILLPEGVKR